MEIKNFFLNGLSEFNNISGRYKLGDKIVNDIEILTKEVENFIIKIPFVGRFNSGKSALLNKLLNSNILPESQKPKTAVATELKYGSDQLVVHNLDGTSNKLEINKLDSVDSESCKYTELYLNSSLFERLDKDFILVDMPGFDSNIKAHNLAIMNYIAQGTFFVIVLDQADGDIKPDTMKFLKEIESYRTNFFVLINKCEKISEKAANNIINQVKHTLENASYKDIKVEVTSIHFEDISEKVLKLLNSISKQELYNKFFSERFNELGGQIIKGLYAIQNTYDIDTADIDKKIQKLENSILQLKDRIKFNRKDLKKRMEEVVPVEILDDVRNTIINNSHSLAVSAVENPQIFGQVLNNIIRPVLVNSTGKYVDQEMAHFSLLFEKDFDDIEKIIGGIKVKYEKFSTAIDKIANMAKTLSESGKFLKSYKVLTTTLAVFTSVIAPWLEIIIIFLPDILKLLGIGTKESRIEKVEEQIRNELAFELAEKLRPEIIESLSKMEDDMVVSIEKQFNDELSVLINALEGSKSHKSNKEEEKKQYLGELALDIKTVENIFSK